MRNIPYLKALLEPIPVLIIALAAACAGVIHAQGRGAAATAEWATSRGDAQRTGWLRNDLFISADRLREPNSAFGLQWKLELSNQQRQLNSLTPAVTIGGSGRFPLSAMGGSSDNVFVFDNVSGIELWERHFEIPTLGAGSLPCPGGLTAGLSRPASLIPRVFVSPPAGVSASTGSFTGGVGQPGEGIPAELMRPGQSLPNGGRTAGPEILKLLDAVLSVPAPPAAPAPGAVAPATGAARVGTGGSAMAANPIFVVASDGVLHTLGQYLGKDILKPVPFLPAHAHASDLVVVDNTVYAATRNGCGGVPDGVWAMDLSQPDIAPVSWNTRGGSPAGAPALGSDGTVFVAIGNGAAGTSRGYSDTVAALDRKSLQIKDWFAEPGADFAASPVIFQYKGMEIVAAVTRDGRIFLLNSVSLGGAGHQAPLSVSAAVSRGTNDFIPGPLTTWEDAGGTRWVLEASARPIPAALGVGSTNGAVTNGAILAYKVAGEAAHLSLQPGWTSRDMVSPLAPIIVNGVVFAIAGGEFHPAAGESMPAAERVRRSVPAVVYALDGSNGKELWNSGKTVTSFVHSGGLWAAGGQVYLAAYDNTLYGFGYPMGRH